MVSVVLRYTHELIKCGLADFIDTSLEGMVENNEGNDNNSFLESIEDYSPVAFASGWALRAGYGNTCGAKHIDKHKSDIDELHYRGNIDQSHEI